MMMSGPATQTDASWVNCWTPCATAPTPRAAAYHLEAPARSALHPGQIPPAGRQKRPERRPLNNARLQVEQANPHVLDRRQFTHKFGRLKRPAHAEHGALARRGVVDVHPLDERGAG